LKKGITSNEIGIAADPMALRKMSTH